MERTRYTAVIACGALLGLGCGGRSGLGESVTFAASIAICGDGQVEGIEQCDDGETRPGDGCSSDCLWEPVSLSCGDSYFCAIGANGKLLCWGANNVGNLGLGDTRTRGGQASDMGTNLPAVDLGGGRTVVAVSTGGTACALLDDRSVKCWGNNYFGQLGQGDQRDRGKLPNDLGDSLPPIDLGSDTTVVSITAGWMHTCALLSGGRVKCWGANEFGQLGLGDTAHRGDEASEMGDDLPFVDLGRGRSALSVLAGGLNTCALLDDRTVKCWGMGRLAGGGLNATGDHSNRGDEPGEMGDSLPTVDLGRGASVERFSLFGVGGHACALLRSGVIKCWGANEVGQLGLPSAGVDDSRGDDPGELGDNLPAVDLGAGRQVAEVSAGASSSCARFFDGAVKCWGGNDMGQLGLPNDRFGSRGSERGDEPGEMGDALPVVDLGTGRTAKSICTGSNANCALLDHGKVKCWGANVTGSLGIGVQSTDIRTDLEDKGAIGDQIGEMGDQLPTIDLHF